MFLCVEQVNLSAWPARQKIHFFRFKGSLANNKSQNISRRPTRKHVFLLAKKTFLLFLQGRPPPNKRTMYHDVPLMTKKQYPPAQLKKNAHQQKSSKTTRSK
jgi:hypothetical protein